MRDCLALQDADRLVPPLVLHFSGGADLVVSPANYVLGARGHGHGVHGGGQLGRPRKSLPMNETTVIGNYMQQNMHVLCDLAGGVCKNQK